MSKKATESVLIDRYHGMGGSYVIVGSEKFRADEQGQPLPHDEPPVAGPIPVAQPEPDPTPEPDPE